jgi:hypothetical protein
MTQEELEHIQAVCRGWLRQSHSIDRFLPDGNTEIVICIGQLLEGYWNRLWPVA